MPFLGTVKEFIIELGWAKGTFAIFFFLAHWYVRKLYRENIKAKQDEIDRIAETNKAMRGENKELRDELRDCYRNSSK